MPYNCFTKGQDARILAELEPIDMEQYFRDLLDDTSEDIVILGMTYTPSNVLESTDPIAFRCCVSDSYDDETMYEASSGDYYWLDACQDLVDGMTDEV